MDAQQSFATKFAAVRAEFEGKVREMGNAAASDAKRLQERYAKYEELRKKIAETIVQPRLDELSRQFPGVKPELKRDIDGARLTLSMPRTPERSALVEIDLGISHDDSFEKVLLAYELRIIPVFIEFEKHSRLTVALDGADLKMISAWLDGQLLAFAKTYLDMQFIEYYQKENIATDPVLNRRFPRTLAVGTHSHSGTEYAFASKESLEMFKADPARYIRLG